MIRAFSLLEVADLLGVPRPAENPSFEQVSTDSRSLEKGALYVALKGERFDGNDFVEQAFASGASGALVSHLPSSHESASIVVPDTLTALGKLAAANRSESEAKLVAITGSSGKTTVKEMCGSIFRAVAPTLVTQGNLNNHIGVPLTLLGLESHHQYGIIELGASGLNEIAYIGGLTRPDVGIITNAGEAHLEGFGSYDNIVQGKGELIDEIKAGGTAVLNFDDPAFAAWRQRALSYDVISVSLKPGAEADYVVTAEGEDQALIEGPGQWSLRVPRRLAGDHNLLNMGMAVAAARALDLADEAIVQGLGSLRAAKGRLNLEKISDQISVIDDTYNANPSAMRAALQVLSKQSGEQIAVLGAMGELGADQERFHQEVGEFARSVGIQRLLAVGSGAAAIAKGFGDGAEVCSDQAAAVELLITTVKAPAVILVKGSRSSAMEIVVEGLKKRIH